MSDGAAKKQDYSKAVDGAAARGPFDGRALFLLVAGVTVLLVIVAAGLYAQDKARHEALYARYEAANALILGDEGADEAAAASFQPDYAAAYAEYAALAQAYPTSDALETKLAVCAYSTGDMQAAEAHAVRAIQLKPQLALDQNFRDLLAEIYRRLDKPALADAVRAYQPPA